MMNKPEYEMLRRIADDIESLHVNHASQRILSEDYLFMGLAGEYTLAKELAITYKISLQPGGDKGIDFNTPIGTVDVKTARKPYWLIVPVENKHPADIYVLAGYQDLGRIVTLIGWTYWNILKEQPAKDFGAGILTHFLEAAQLSPMVLLQREILRVLIDHGGQRVWQLKLI